MNMKIYKQIAQKHGVAVDEVKREIEAAIYETYKNHSTAALAVPRKGELPTPDEFIAYCVNIATPRSVKIKTLNQGSKV